MSSPPLPASVSGQMPTFNTCPACGTRTLNAAGIGPFCPKLACDRVDDLRPSPEQRELAQTDSISEQNAKLLAALRYARRYCIPEAWPTIDAALKAAQVQP